MDPKGSFGLGIVEVDDEAAARELMHRDPTMKSGLGFRFDISPMRVGMIRKA